jgi:hypothetical protein
MRFGRQDTATVEPDAPAPLNVDLDVREREEFQRVDEQTRKAIEQADRLTGEIGDPEAASEATDALASLRNAIDDGETARKALKKPFDAAGKRVQAAFKELASPLEARKKSLEDRFLAYEEKREAEERERREREEAEARKAQEEAEQAQDAAAESQARQDLHRAQAPRVQPTGARGASGAKSSPTAELKYDIVDEDALPDEYVERVPRRAKILADVRQGIAIPGVQPYRDKRVQVR